MMRSIGGMRINILIVEIRNRSIERKRRRGKEQRIDVDKSV